MAAGELTTSFSYRDGVPVLVVVGDVDLLTAPVLQRGVDDLIGQGSEEFVIDLSGIEFFASAGLRILAETHEKVSAAARLAVVANSAATVRPIQLTSLDDLLTVCATLDDAVAALRYGGSDH